MKGHLTDMDRPPFRANEIRELVGRGVVSREVAEAYLALANQKI